MHIAPVTNQPYPTKIVGRNELQDYDVLVIQLPCVGTRMDNYFVSVSRNVRKHTHTHTHTHARTHARTHTYTHVRRHVRSHAHNLCNMYLKVPLSLCCVVTFESSLLRQLCSTLCPSMLPGCPVYSCHAIGDINCRQHININTLAVRAILFVKRQTRHH